jgi:hypothetical protein
MRIKDCLRVPQRKAYGGKSLLRPGLRALPALCTILAATAACGQELLLDLTKASEVMSKTHCFDGGGLGGRIDGPPLHVLPLELQVVKLNASSHREGDPGLVL